MENQTEETTELPSEYLGFFGYRNEGEVAEKDAGMLHYLYNLVKDARGAEGVVPGLANAEKRMGKRDARQSKVAQFYAKFRLTEEADKLFGS